MFGYNINNLKSEIDSFDKLARVFKKNKNSKKAKVELDIIEENLSSKIESMLMAENSEIDPFKKDKNTNLILKQKTKLLKSVMSYDNSLLSLKNFLSCKLALFSSTKRLLFRKRNSIISLLVLLFILFPLLSLSLLLILLKFLFRKKDKSKKKKKKVNLNDVKNLDIDDKLFDMADRYAKNKELEETLKKLKNDPLFKDLIDEQNLPKLFKELGDMLEKQISDLKYTNPELFPKIEKEINGISEEKKGLLSTIIETIPNKLANKVKKNKKAMATSINEEMSKVKVKIKKFKNMNKKLMASHAHHELFDMFVPVNRKGPKSKKLKPKVRSLDDIVNDYKIKNKKFKTKKKKYEVMKYGKIKKHKNIKHKEFDLGNIIKEVNQFNEKSFKKTNKIGSKKRESGNFEKAIKNMNAKSKGGLSR